MHFCCSASERLLSQDERVTKKGSRNVLKARIVVGAILYQVTTEEEFTEATMTALLQDPFIESITTVMKKQAMQQVFRDTLKVFVVLAVEDGVFKKEKGNDAAATLRFVIANADVALPEVNKRLDMVITQAVKRSLAVKDLFGATILNDIIDDGNYWHFWKGVCVQKSTQQATTQQVVEREPTQKESEYLLKLAKRSWSFYKRLYDIWEDAVEAGKEFAANWFVDKVLALQKDDLCNPDLDAISEQDLISQVKEGTSDALEKLTFLSQREIQRCETTFMIHSGVVGRKFRERQLLPALVTRLVKLSSERPKVAVFGGKYVTYMQTCLGGYESSSRMPFPKHCKPGRGSWNRGVGEGARVFWENVFAYIQAFLWMLDVSWKEPGDAAPSEKDMEDLARKLGQSYEDTVNNFLVCLGLMDKRELLSEGCFDEAITDVQHNLIPLILLLQLFIHLLPENAIERVKELVDAINVAKAEAAKSHKAFKDQRPGSIDAQRSVQDIARWVVWSLYDRDETKLGLKELVKTALLQWAGPSIVGKENQVVWPILDLAIRMNETVCRDYDTVCSKSSLVKATTRVQSLLGNSLSEIDMAKFESLAQQIADSSEVGGFMRLCLRPDYDSGDRMTGDDASNEETEMAFKASKLDMTKRLLQASLKSVGWDPSQGGIFTSSSTTKSNRSETVAARFVSRLEGDVNVNLLGMVTKESTKESQGYQPSVIPDDFEEGVGATASCIHRLFTLPGSRESGDVRKAWSSNFVENREDLSAQLLFDAGTRLSGVAPKKKSGLNFASLIVKCLETESASKKIAEEIEKVASEIDYHIPVLGKSWTEDPEAVAAAARLKGLQWVPHWEPSYPDIESLEKLPTCDTAQMMDYFVDIPAEVRTIGGVDFNFPHVKVKLVRLAGGRCELGLFCGGQPIEPGTWICIYGGKLVGKEMCKKLEHLGQGTHLMTVSTIRFIWYIDGRVCSEEEGTQFCLDHCLSSLINAPYPMDLSKINAKHVEVPEAELTYAVRYPTLEQRRKESSVGRTSFVTLRKGEVKGTVATKRIEKDQEILADLCGKQLRWIADKHAKAEEEEAEKLSESSGGSDGGCYSSSHDSESDNTNDNNQDMSSSKALTALEEWDGTVEVVKYLVDIQHHDDSKMAMAKRLATAADSVLDIFSAVGEGDLLSVEGRQRVRQHEEEVKNLSQKIMPNMSERILTIGKKYWGEEPQHLITLLPHPY
jgi:hypothetical protein